MTELEALRRFHALFSDERGNWGGISRPMLNADEPDCSPSRIWQDAKNARKEYPECSGDPRSCPENEGFGCCKPNLAMGTETQHCVYPNCKCPFDAPADLKWCFLGFRRVPPTGY